MAQRNDSQRDPAQRQRSNNIRATVRALVVVYLFYLIFQMIRGYCRGEDGMTLPILCVFVVVFLAAAIYIAVASYRRFHSEQENIRRLWDELDAEQAAELLAEEFDDETDVDEYEDMPDEKEEPAP